MEHLLENLGLIQDGTVLPGFIFGVVHVSLVILGFYTGWSINRLLKNATKGYIAGIIGWSGREYVRAVRGQKNAAENEIIIDTSLAWQCIKKGAAWPLHANREGKNGALREKDNNVSLNGPRG